MSFMVNEEDVDEAVRSLHNKFFAAPDESIFDVVARDLQARDAEELLEAASGGRVKVGNGEGLVSSSRWRSPPLRRGCLVAAEKQHLAGLTLQGGASACRVIRHLHRRSPLSRRPCSPPLPIRGASQRTRCHSPGVVFGADMVSRTIFLIELHELPSMRSASATRPDRRA